MKIILLVKSINRNIYTRIYFFMNNYKLTMIRTFNPNIRMLWMIIELILFIVWNFGNKYLYVYLYPLILFVYKNNFHLCFIYITINKIYTIFIILDDTYDILNVKTTYFTTLNDIINHNILLILVLNYIFVRKYDVSKNWKYYVYHLFIHY